MTPISDPDNCIMQLTAIGDGWGSHVLKGWPTCWTAPEAATALATAWLAMPVLVMEKAPLPPKHEYLYVMSLPAITLLTNEIGTIWITYTSQRKNMEEELGLQILFSFLALTTVHNMTIQ
ncbi:hypothetical protein GUJ93_ZPchr0006g41874 [Zizania palustris]|uniref:Uncharacterized protein n=1 Tax=Zizania palustris TaxID=103762 RepID=A0A8J5W1C7_ZIZPA|nr:hypothetical protein GUJ93_ZPchr0006g41874 [Zizania palustris]